MAFGTKVLIVAYLACLLATELHSQYVRPSASSDFESVSNVVYDVGASINSRGTSSSGGRHKNKLAAPFPKRMTLKVEEGTSAFKACGGFSGGFSGTCCTACMKLNYKTGCWCRTWDCLCFDE